MAKKRINRLATNAASIGDSRPFATSATKRLSTLSTTVEMQGLSNLSKLEHTFLQMIGFQSSFQYLIESSKPQPFILEAFVSYKNGNKTI
jgi:hypothetical protein